MSAPSSAPRAATQAASNVLWPLLLATEHGPQDRGAERVAFAFAATLAQQPLAVVMPLASNPEYEAVAPQRAAQAEADVARRREALTAAAASGGVSLEVQVRRGSEPHAEIIEAAREAGPSALLVIRRRGQRGILANLLIGEMVSKVLAQALCSVLVVPRDAAPPCAGLLVGVHPQHRGDGPGQALVAQAAGLAAALGLPLHLSCVVARESDRALATAALAQARAALSAPPASAEVRIGAAHAELVAAAQALGADLIAVARHGGPAPGRGRVGGVAEKVIGLARCAVLMQVDATASTPVAEPAGTVR
jgi:nucleotide-binding universal stress UspA family protein